MALYNITSLTESLNFGELALWANAASDGVLFGFFTIAIFFVVVLALKRYDFADGLLVGAFVSFVISGILTYGGFLNIIFPLCFLIIVALSGFYVWMTKRN